MKTTIDQAVIAEMLAGVRALPDPNTDDIFDFELRDVFLKRWGDSWQGTWTDRMIETPEDDDEFELAEVDVRNAAQGSDDYGDVSFKLFCARLVWLARRESTKDFEMVLASGRVEYGREPYYRALEAQHGCSESDEDRIRAAHRLAVGLIESGGFSKRPAVLHTAGELTAHLHERINDATPSAEALGEIASGLQYVEDAAWHVDKLIGRSYPKYFATSARLKLLQGDFNGAMSDINIAIDGENPSSYEGIIRLGQFHILRTKIDMARRIVSHEHDVELHKNRLQDIELAFEGMEAEFRDQSERQQGRMMEILGLLAAVIAFLVAGTSAALNVGGGRNTIVVVAALGASIVAVFATFRLLFVLDSNERRRGLDIIRDDDGNVVLDARGRPKRREVNMITDADIWWQRGATVGLILCSALVIWMLMIWGVSDQPDSASGSGGATSAVEKVQPQ